MFHYRWLRRLHYETFFFIMFFSYAKASNFIPSNQLTWNLTRFYDNLFTLSRYVFIHESWNGFTRSVRRSWIRKYQGARGWHAARGYTLASFSLILCHHFYRLFEENWVLVLTRDQRWGWGVNFLDVLRYWYSKRIIFTISYIYIDKFCPITFGMKIWINRAENWSSCRNILIFQIERSRIRLHC